MAFMFSASHDALSARAGIKLQAFLMDASLLNDLKEKMLNFRRRARHIIMRFTERRQIIATRFTLLKDLVHEEKRVLIEILN
jgi:hypothetical protein